MEWLDDVYEGWCVVDGTDLYTEYGLVPTDEYDLGCPEVKSYTVDIPGGNGVIDLTEAFTGWPVFDNRSMSLELLAPGCTATELTQLVGKLRGAFHGRRLGFQLGMIDPGYTYTGRISLGSPTHEGTHGLIPVTIDADPYKLKEVCTYSADGAGGVTFVFESGQMPVHPVVESDTDFTVIWDGVSYSCEASTAYLLRFVTFTEGENVLYINSHQLENVTWGDLAEGGEAASTWGSLSETTWDGVQKLLDKDDTVANVYVSYEWKDL